MIMFLLTVVYTCVSECVCAMCLLALEFTISFMIVSHSLANLA